MRKVVLKGVLPIIMSTFSAQFDSTGLEVGSNDGYIEIRL